MIKLSFENKKKKDAIEIGVVYEAITRSVNQS